MATKEDNIRRLQALAAILGREVDISGSAMDIRQRVIEWEEEAGGDAAPDEGAGPDERQASADDAPVVQDVASKESPASFLTVRVLASVHLFALSPEGNEIADSVDAGTLVQIPQAHFRELEAAGLVCAV